MSDTFVGGCSHKIGRINERFCFNCRKTIKDFVQHKCDILLCYKCNAKINTGVLCEDCMKTTRQDPKDVFHELVRKR